MNSETFNNIIENRINLCKNVLCIKAGEYATEDRLHNFKVAAELQGVTPITALAGMMCKHTVSVYDLIQTHEAGLPVSQGMWDEKIGDSINYLLLLTALIEDERMSQTCGEACADKED